MRDWAFPSVHTKHRRCVCCALRGNIQEPMHCPSAAAQVALPSLTPASLRQTSQQPQRGHATSRMLCHRASAATCAAQHHIQRAVQAATEGWHVSISANPPVHSKHSWCACCTLVGRYWLTQAGRLHQPVQFSLLSAFAQGRMSCVCCCGGHHVQDREQMQLLQLLPTIAEACRHCQANEAATLQLTARTKTRCQLLQTGHCAFAVPSSSGQHGCCGRPLCVPCLPWSVNRKHSCCACRPFTAENMAHKMSAHSSNAAGQWF